MPKIFTSYKQKIGQSGEDIACEFLMKQGYAILERNYTKKWGEVDIIAEKEGKLHFVEVKSVSRETLEDVTPDLPAQAGTLDQYHPEDNMHPWKLKRLARTIQTYLLSKHLDEEWQVDLLVVFLSLKDRSAKIKVVKDIIL